MKNGIAITIVTVLMMVVGITMAGCTHNQLALKKDGTLDQATSTASVGRIMENGQIITANHGNVGSGIVQDSEGHYSFQGVPSGVCTFDAQTNTFYLISPSDAVLTGVKFTPNPDDGQPAFEATSMSFNISEPLKQQVIAYAQAVLSLEGMIQTEATARVERMKIAGEITADIAEMLLRYFIPTLPIAQAIVPSPVADLLSDPADSSPAGA